MEVTEDLVREFYVNPSQISKVKNEKISHRTLDAVDDFTEYLQKVNKKVNEKVKENAAAEGGQLSEKQKRQVAENYYKKRFGYKYDFDLNKDSLNYYATVKTAE